MAGDDKAMPVCAECGREQHRQPGEDCDNPDWHVWPEAPADDAPAPPLHLGLELERLELVAITLHAAWCPTAGAGCSYSVRDLQVALDLTAAVRGG